MFPVAPAAEYASATFTPAFELEFKTRTASTSYTLLAASAIVRPGPEPGAMFVAVVFVVAKSAVVICSPVVHMFGPAGPWAPVAPVAPAAPVAPVAPGSPWGPCEPVAPVAPAAPVSPVSPLTPWGP